MKAKFIILAFVLFLSFEIQNSKKLWKNSNPLEYTFSDYMVEFNKNYQTEAEVRIRELTFNDNLRKIIEINSNPKFTWTAGINHLSDRIPEELKSLTGLNRNLKFFNHKEIKGEMSKDFLKNLPEEVDWRKEGVTTPVKNQANCGSCWAFSTSAVLESHLAIQNSGKNVIVSPQELVDCVENKQKCGGTGGCNGATQELGFNYVKNHGLSALEDYPYFAKEGKCLANEKKKIATVGDFVKLPENDYNSLMTAVATKGPVSVSVAANEWHLYEKGVYNGFCGTEVNHVVALEGYGVDEKGNDYWLVRNSWTTQWGEEGYIRVKRAKNAKEVVCDIDTNPNVGNGCEGGPDKITVCGLCGILSDAAYPVNAQLIDN